MVNPFFPRLSALSLTSTAAAATERHTTLALHIPVGGVGRTACNFFGHCGLTWIVVLQSHTPPSPMGWRRRRGSFNYLGCLGPLLSALVVVSICIGLLTATFHSLRGCL